MIKVKFPSTLLVLSIFSFLSCTESNPSSVDPKPGPSLTISQSSFDFRGKDSVAVLVISVQNTDSLNWFIDSRRHFVTVSPTSGVVHRDHSDSISVTVHRSGVPYGVQRAVFDLIQLPDSVKTKVAISMEVLPPTPPSPEVSVTRLDFPSELSQQTIILSNGGEQPLIWTVDTITDGPYGQHDRERSANWLSIEPFSGQLSQCSETLSVSINRTILLPGLTTGQLWLNTNADTFCISVEVEFGKKIWECRFDQPYSFSHNWIGYGTHLDNVLYIQPGCRISPRPEVVPLIRDAHAISVQCRTGKPIPVYSDYFRNYLSSRYLNAKIFNIGRILGNIDSSIWPYRCTFVVPADSSSDSGPLKLDLFVDYLDEYESFHSDLTIYSVEVWEK